jgi:predicted metal-dependent hydrolase
MIDPPLSSSRARCSERPDERLVEAICLFNAGEYFECHEVLEVIWRAETDAIRVLYQGILQIGVALHHLRRDNWRGAIKLLRAGSQKIADFQPRCLGVDTAALLQSARACLERLEALGPERAREFDWTLAPIITIDTEAVSASSARDRRS